MSYLTTTPFTKALKVPFFVNLIRFVIYTIEGEKQRSNFFIFIIYLSHTLKGTL
jgi:hypothetical protein